MQAEISARRARFAEQMLNNSAAVFFAAPEVIRSNDTHYPYRQNSDFWYLTQFNEPDAVLVLIKSDHGALRRILFNRAKDPAAEIWTGYRLGQTAALAELQVDEAYTYAQLPDILPTLLSHLRALYHADQLYPYADQIINQTLTTLRNGLRQNLRAPTTLIDWRPVLHEMRLFKSAKECELMRQAGKITAAAHKRAMQVCRPGLYEYQLEAEILHEFAMHGARSPSYNTIVGGGANGCILHYENNDALLNAGDLVLIDAGCEYQHYAGDITRTFPVSGQFSPAQRAIYNIVLEAQCYAIDNLVAGNSIKAVNQHVIEIMLQGLIDLSILSGDVATLKADNAHLDFYMHGLGHWLGIDVHDVGDYQSAKRDRPLEVGMVLTVEPGLYIKPDANVPDVYRGIGIRIEDNILITASGNEVLTRDVPKTPADIERLMQSAK